MSVIKVEHFSTDVGADGSTFTLTNSVGGVNKAFVKIINANTKGSCGPTGSTGDCTPNILHCGVQLTGTSTLTFQKNTSTTVKVVGEVWRYTGKSGGKHEFKVRGRHSVTFGTDSSKSQAISNISNEDKCVPFITGVDSNITSISNHEKSTFGIHMDGSGNCVVSRKPTSGVATVYFTVVEFTGSDWKIGHGKSASHDSSMETVTLNTDSDGVSGTTFDVSDWEQAFMEASMEGDSSENGLADIQAMVFPGANTTTVSFGGNILDSAARNDGVGWVHVMKNSSLIVKREYTEVTEGNGTYGTDLSFPTGTSTSRDLDQLGLEWFCGSNGTGTAHARGHLGGSITSASGTIRHWVHRIKNTVRVARGVIDLSQLNDPIDDTLYKQGEVFGIIAQNGLNELVSLLED